MWKFCNPWVITTLKTAHTDEFHFSSGCATNKTKTVQHTVRAYGLRNEGSVPGLGRISSLCPNVQTNCEAFMVYTRNAFLKGKLAGARS